MPSSVLPAAHRAIPVLCHRPPPPAVPLPGHAARLAVPTTAAAAAPATRARPHVTAASTSRGAAHRRAV
jgi:hypothetical protein